MPVREKQGFGGKIAYANAMLLHMLLDMQMHMQMDMLLYGDLHKKHPEKCLRNTPENALFFMPVL